MSHDQKPARVRVVRNAAAPTLRRRGDPAVGAVVLDHEAGIPADDPAPGGAAPLRVGAIGIAVVLVAAAGAGVTVALLGQP